MEYPQLLTLFQKPTRNGLIQELTLEILLNTHHAHIHMHKDAHSLARKIDVLLNVIIIYTDNKCLFFLDYQCLEDEYDSCVDDINRDMEDSEDPLEDEHHSQEQNQR